MREAQMREEFLKRYGHSTDYQVREEFLKRYRKCNKLSVYMHSFPGMID